MPVLDGPFIEARSDVIFDSPILGRTEWLATALLCLIVSGCATSTSATRSAEISSDLRPATRNASDDAVSREARAQQLFLRAMTQARLGRHDDALDLFAQALQLAPSTAAILAAAAESHAALGDDAAAVYSLQRARAADPGNMHVSLQLAELFLGSGDHASAAHLYLEILERSPHNLDALYELAHVYTLTGELAQAVSTYERLLREIGSDRDVQDQILHLYGRLEDEEGMERTLTEMLRQNPNDAQLRRTLAELYLEQDRTEDALEELEEALEADPGDVQALMSLAELYRVLGRSEDAEDLMNRAANPEAMNPSQLLARVEPLFERAESDAEAQEAVEHMLDRVLELDARNEKALRMLGALHIDRQEHAAAGELYYRALDVNPRDPQLWMQAAGAFLQAGRLQRAAEVADEGLMLFPGSVSLLRIGGYALMDAYENTEAVSHFEEAVRIIREDESEDATSLSDLHSALGLLYIRLDDPERSDRAFERAIDLEPDNAAVLNNFAYSLAERPAEMDRALDLAERAVDLDPNTPAYRDTYGWILYRMGDLDEALRQILGAASESGASATIFDHLGDVYHARGESAKAVAAWTRALEMDPGNTALMQKLDRF